MIPLRDLSRADRPSFVTPLIVIACLAAFGGLSLAGSNAEQWGKLRVRDDPRNNLG